MQEALLAILAGGVEANTTPLPISPAADDLDAIATGINILLDELRYELKMDRQLADELDRIFDTLTDALLVLDREGVIVRANAASEALLGRPASALHGQPIAEVYESPQAAHALLGRLAEMSRVQDFEARCQSPEGKSIEVMVSASLLRGSGQTSASPSKPGAPAIVWVARDVRELKRLLRAAALAQSERERADALAKAHAELAAAHSELRSTQDQLLQAQKMDAIGQLAGGISHDFNNLLLVILASAEFVRSRVAHDTAATEEIDEVIAAAERAAALTQGLLALSRKPAPDGPVVSTNAVVKSLTTMLRRMVGENIRWDIALAADLWTAKIDPSALEQVIVNLVINARDAMPGGGVLTVRTDNRRLEASQLAALSLPAGDYAQLSVRDTGVGMSMQTQQRAFEPFFTTKQRADGTGLGLSNCYGIVTQAGGTITVDSEIGEGTSFRVLLPRVESTDGAPAPTAHREHQLPPGSERVLIAEDEPAVRRMIARTLQARGYTVSLAVDGRDALAQYSHATDIVITDLMMPHMGGVELGRELRARSPDVKILYITGYTERAPELTAGRSALLHKPFTGRQLLQSVADLLGTDG